MNEIHGRQDERQEGTVPTSIHVGEVEKPKYVSKRKGAPGFSGRSTRTIHAACARARGSAKLGQQKQIK